MIAEKGAVMAKTPRVELLEAIEILDVTREARKSIEAVQPWRA